MITLEPNRIRAGKVSLPTIGDWGRNHVQNAGFFEQPRLGITYRYNYTDYPNYCWEIRDIQFLSRFTIFSLIRIL